MAASPRGTIPVRGNARFGPNLRESAVAGQNRIGSRVSFRRELLLLCIYFLC